MANRSLITLHLLHEVGISVEYLNQRKERIVTKLHEADLSLNLIKRHVVVTIIKMAC